MTTLDHLRNALISKLLTIQDEAILAALDKLVSQSVEDQKVPLSNEQLEMLAMSDQDLEHGHVISQQALFEQERKWLSEQ
jgi:hypothetical protein